MCFSASASFGAGVALCAVGLLTLKKVQSPSQFLFACIPLSFSLQQLAEGFVWLSLTNSDYAAWKLPATLVFLFFAQVVWPVFVPLAIYLLEKNAKRKKILLVITVMGCMVALYLAFCLLSYPVNATIVSFHINYTLNFPLAFTFITGAFYFIPTVFPPLLSSNKKIPLLGVAITASYVFTILFYANYLISVWCFFAAIISVLVLYIITEINKSPVKKITAPGIDRA